MAKGRDLSSLTGIRFVAAFWVLVYHQGTAGGLLAHAMRAVPGFAANVVRTGYSAVGLFFVLSGFILAYNYRDERLNKRQFWAARVARVYPVYLLALLLVAPPILAKVAMHLAPARELGNGLLSIVLLQAWNPHAALSWNGPGWSLSVEAFFYLLFPFVLAAVRGFTPSRLVFGMLVMAAAVLVVPSICLLLHLSDLQGVSATDVPAAGFWCNVVKFNPLIRLPEFVFGVLLGRLFLLRSRDASRPVSGGRLSLRAAVAIVVACGAFGPYISYPFIHNNALILFNGLLVYGLACGGGPLDRILSHGWFVRLGEASYAVYLLHVPIDDWLMRLDKKTLHLAATHPGLLFVCYAAAVVVASLAVYQWVEEPARKYLRRKLTAAPREAALRPEVVLT